MTISRISSATNAGDTITIPTHAVGDTIFIFAYNDGTTVVPTLPAGVGDWLNITNGSGGSSAARVAYKVAESSSETSGTWTNADGLIAIVYRSDAGLVVPTYAGFNTGTSATVNYASFGAPQNRENVDQWMLGLASQRNDTNALEAAPTGLTNITSLTGTGWKIAAHDSNADANSYTSANVTVTTSAAWRTIVFSIFEQPYPSSSGGGALFLPRGFDGGYVA